MTRNDYHRAARWYNENFGMTCVPVDGKKPAMKWRGLQRLVSLAEIDRMPWHHATGLIAICGVNDLALVDGDNVTDEAMRIIAAELGLLKSQWRSGGPGRNWRHLWVIAPGLVDLTVVGKVDRDARPEYWDGSNERHHIEIRHRGHIGVLPPSEHPSRPGLYAFAAGWPTEPPPVVDPAALLAAYELVTVPKPEPIIVRSGVTYASTSDEKAVHIARECLKRLASWRADQYHPWIKVGMSLCALGAEGLALWDEWSSKGKGYKPGECEKAWRYLSPDGITQASLTAWANEDSQRTNHPLVSVGETINLKRFALPSDVLNAIAGYAPIWGQPRPVADRSKADWVVIKNLVERGVTDAEIVAIFQQNPIGKGKYAERGDNYLSDTIQEARKRFKVMATEGEGDGLQNRVRQV